MTRKTKKTKRVRWSCPVDLHPGALGSSRPRKNAMVRYCIPCSETSGYLVERVAPALVKKRDTRSAARTEQRKTKATKARADETAKFTIGGIDFREELRLLWLCPVNTRRRRHVPQLHIRHCPSKPSSVVGRGWYDGSRVQVSVWPGVSVAYTLETLAHEVVHALGLHHHDLDFATRLATLTHERWGIDTFGLVQGRAAWRKVGRFTTAALKGRPEYAGRSYKASVSVRPPTWDLTLAEDGRVRVRVTSGCHDALQCYVVDIAEDPERLALADCIELAEKAGAKASTFLLPEERLEQLRTEIDYFTGSFLHRSEDYSWLKGASRLAHAIEQWNEGKLWSSRGASFKKNWGWSGGVERAREVTDDS